MRALRVGVAVCCAAVTGCASSPSIPPERLAGWSSIRQSSFRLLGVAPTDELRRLAGDLALFDRVFTLLAGMPAEPLEPVSIFLFEDPELARRFGLAGPVAGWMVATLEGCFAAVRAGRTHVEMRATLLHEYTHALLRRNRRGPLPPWYDEGLSTYFSTFSVRDGGAVVGGAPSAEITRLVARGPIPLPILFERPGWGRAQPQVYDFYATAWAFAHLQLATPRGRNELAGFASRLERGEPWSDAQTAAFGRPVHALESELARHVRLLARGVAAEFVIDPGDLGAPGRIGLAEQSTAEVAYELGFLALQVGDRHPRGSKAPLARALFDAALAADPSASRAEAALAEALTLEGDAPEALALSGRAVGAAPDDARIRIHAGRVQIARSDAEGASGTQRHTALRSAAEHFREALDRDPASAAAWEGLAQTRLRQGRRDEAVAAFERARGLAWSPQLDLALGTLELEQGRRKEAIALLAPLAGDPHGGSIREEARAKLDQAGLLPQEADATR